MANRVEVKSKDLDGKDTTVYVTRPNDKDYKEAQNVATKTFSDAVKNGALLRIKLNSYMEEQGLWDKSKQKKLDNIDKDIQDNMVKLRGGIKLTEAKKAALQIRADRFDRTTMMDQHRSLDEFTAEGQAENARFDYLVFSSIKNEEGDRVFKDMDDYKERGHAPFAIDAASALASLLFGMKENWESDLPENKFLKRFSFVNDDLRLVNKDGKLIDSENKLIDENGRYIDEEGNYVDVDGSPVDEEGLPIVEEQPFLDEDGSPIIEEVEEEAEKSPDASEG